MSLPARRQKLQDRLNDLQHELGLALPSNLILETTKPIPLDKESGRQELDDLLTNVEQQYEKVKVLVLDPRRYTMIGDENQSEILTKWCANLDDVPSKHNLAVVIVHHEGKATTGAGRGSSVFDGWLDTPLKLEPSNRPSFGQAPGAQVFNLDATQLHITSRDAESRSIWISFQYPLWKETANEATQRMTKVGNAAKYILDDRLNNAPTRELDLMELRMGAMKLGHSDHSFKQALDQLEKEAKIERVQIPGAKGNKKKVVLLGP